jgi:hypothetical protein
VGRIAGGVVCLLLLLSAWCPRSRADSQENGPPKLRIPLLTGAPALEDFVSMQPSSPAAQQMFKVTGFVQRNPHDGKSASQATEAYLGYDQKNLYAVFVCFDDPAKVRARRARREDIFDDDNVEIMIDSFHDQRRAYAFQTNPLGVQWDAVWTEESGFDSTFDSLWYSRGKVTDKGFVVWMAIPFRSLRFSAQAQQDWGIILYRGIVRDNEDDFWPAMSAKVAGRLDRAADASGLEKISPGRNLQFIPYGLFNSFRTLNTTDFANPRWDNRMAGGKIGLDSKFILNDSLVLDVAANPDFSQVESDDPQVTVNQRFEVFFPEKRPFFIENSDYFSTPINLLFTRRIADPEFGTRLSGRVGHFGLGLLLADDKSPGEIVAPSDREFGKKAYFVIGRVKRDIFKQSAIGAMFTDREFDGSFNRVGGVDGLMRFSKTWTGSFQGVVSSTRGMDGSYQAGPAFSINTAKAGLHLNYGGGYSDYSPGFLTQSGFVNRVDTRSMTHDLIYTFRPKDSWLLGWGPEVSVFNIWDHHGVRLDSLYEPALVLNFKRQTYARIEPYISFRQRLRPSDFPSLTQNQDYGEHYSLYSAGTSASKKVSLNFGYSRGNRINFVTVGNQPPAPARSEFADADITVRPITALKIENTYIFDRLEDGATGRSIFNNHLVQTKWNWQFNNELSVRFILQYRSTLANQQFTSLQTTKQLSPQFLITYLVHPGTAVYVGYNSDLQNIDPTLAVDPNSGLLLRSRNRLINDNREFFVKVSYLLRF